MNFPGAFGFSLNSSIFAPNMKFRPFIIISFLSLIAAPADQIWACGSGLADKTEQAHVESSEKDDLVANGFHSAGAGDSKSCCDHENSGRGCPCDDEKGGCHCPGGGMICHSGPTWAAENHFQPLYHFLNISAQKKAFYFAEHMPEAVYLSIWHPPKITA